MEQVETSRVLRASKHMTGTLERRAEAPADTRAAVTRIVRRAVILAAGSGPPSQNPPHDSKLLEPLLGKPILLRTLEAAHDAGVRAATIVVGYQAERVRQTAERGAPSGMHLTFAHNPEWRLENGVSALAARASVAGDRFALLMGDHVFEPPMLQRMLRAAVEPTTSLLAVDAPPVSAPQEHEATKVEHHGSRIVAIRKDLLEYDALDTGVFVFSPMLFDA